MRLLDHFIPLLAYIRQFQLLPAGTVQSVVAVIDQLIADAKKTSLASGFNSLECDDALFSVCAWADEVLLAAHWSGATEWKRLLLQRKYFNVSNAGIAFFTRLDNLSPQQIQVREVYFYCLSLGFSGRYGHDQTPKALADLKQVNLRLLGAGTNDSHAEAGKFLFPAAYASTGAPKNELKSVATKRWRWKVSSLTVNVLLVPLLVLIVLYGVYHLIIWQTANTIMAQIK